MATPPSKRHPGSLFQPALSAFHQNKCKDPSHPSHYDKKPNGATCQGDDDNLEDLCMGTKRTYDEKLKPGKFEIMGVNCDGDSEVEGDVFWTMYPKYKLSY